MGSTLIGVAFYRAKGYTPWKICTRI